LQKVVSRSWLGHARIISRACTRLNKALLGPSIYFLEGLVKNVTWSCYDKSQNLVQIIENFYQVHGNMSWKNLPTPWSDLEMEIIILNSCPHLHWIIAVSLSWFIESCHVKVWQIHFSNLILWQQCTWSIWRFPFLYIYGWLSSKWSCICNFLGPNVFLYGPPTQPISTIHIIHIFMFRPCAWCWCT